MLAGDMATSEAAYADRRGVYASEGMDPGREGHCKVKIAVDGKCFNSHCKAIACSPEIASSSPKRGLLAMTPLNNFPGK